MQKVVLLFFLVLNAVIAQSNEFRAYYGFSESELLRSEELIGSGKYEVQSSTEYGVKYLRKLRENIYAEIGLNFLQVDVMITPSYTGSQVVSMMEKIKLISFPIYINFSFWDYFFFNSGPIVEFQNSTKTVDSQSGIGFSFGFGGKYNFDDFVIFINPNFKKHSFVPFKKENNHQKLTELGIQVGVGYKF